MSSDDELNAKLKKLSVRYQTEIDHQQGLRRPRADNRGLRLASRGHSRGSGRRTVSASRAARSGALVISGAAAGLVGGLAVAHNVIGVIVAALVLGAAIGAPKISESILDHRSGGTPKQVPGDRLRLRSVARQAASPSFWDALDPAERQALNSAASVRQFAPGVPLMREGERADHVMVILLGRTKVCVRDGGGERRLAERGPGELVGERAGLQVSVRSASVIALEPVWALVVRTSDFAAFIGEHPRVLEIVERQLYDRLTQKPTGGGDNLSSARAARAAVGQVGRDPSPRRKLSLLGGENCTIILSDVVGFGARTRDDEDRRVIREALFSMTHTALQDVSNVGSWDDRGDGLMVVVPPSVASANVMRELFRELPSALKRYNSTHRPSARIQLRLAVNVGPVVNDIMGICGEAIMVAARLADAPIFKRAIADSQADLGVIASAFVYENVIRRSVDTIDLRGYSQVKVDTREYSIPAWMRLVTPDDTHRGISGQPRDPVP